MAIKFFSKILGTYVQNMCNVRAATEENVRELSFLYCNINSVIIKGEGVVKRSEVQVLFFCNWLFLPYISPFFVVCVRLAAAITG